MQIYVNSTLFLFKLCYYKNNLNEINKGIKMNIVLCAVVKTIGVLVSVTLFACGFVWILENISPDTIMKFFAAVMTLLMVISVIGQLYIKMYQSCEASNQKKTTSVQANTET